MHNVCIKLLIFCENSIAVLIWQNFNLTEKFLNFLQKKKQKFQKFNIKNNCELRIEMTLDKKAARNS